MSTVFARRFTINKRIADRVDRSMAAWLVALSMITAVSSELFRRALATGLMDIVLRQRARSVLYRSGLFQHLPLSGRMLEVGAGSGHLGEAVMRRAPSRQCVVADPMLTPPPLLAARMARRDFAAVRAGGQALPFADARFDAIWSSFYLQRLSAAAQERVLAEMSRVVRPGGTLILIGDAPPSRVQLLKHGWQQRDEIAFSRLFPPAGLHRARHRTLVCRRAMSVEH